MIHARPYRHTVALFLVAFLGFATAPCSAADPIRARVVNVIDGDTLDVLFDRGAPAGFSAQERIRLRGVDTMETSRNEKLFKDAAYYGIEPDVLLRWGVTAKVRLSRMLPRGSDITVALDAHTERDRYRRLLTRVYVQSQDVGVILLSEGLAIVYRKSDYAEKHAYLELERKVFNLNVGMWGERSMREGLGQKLRLHQAAAPYRSALLH